MILVSNWSSSCCVSFFWVCIFEEFCILVDDIDLEDDREYKEDDDDIWGVVLILVFKIFVFEVIVCYVVNISFGLDMLFVVGDDDEDEECKS